MTVRKIQKLPELISLAIKGKSEKMAKQAVLDISKHKNVNKEILKKIVLKTKYKKVCLEALKFLILRPETQAKDVQEITNGPNQKLITALIEKISGDKV